MRKPKRAVWQTRCGTIPWRVSVLIVAALAVGLWISMHSATHQLASHSPVLHKTLWRPVPPSQTESKVTVADSPNLSTPKYLSIPALSINDAQVIPVGTEQSGEMETPDDNWHVGWYEYSAKPGTGHGAVLLNGHRGIAHDAVFQYLHNIQRGDIIDVEDGWGRTTRYEVYQVEQIPLGQVDMRELMFSANPSRQGLNILTCGGSLKDDHETYNDRVIVYAVQTES